MAGVWVGACERSAIHDLAAIHSWIEGSFGSTIGEVLGPEGARVFSVWGDDEGSPGPEAILVVAPICVDLGTPSAQEIRLYVDADTDMVEAIVVLLDPPMRLSQIEALLGEVGDRRLCEPGSESDVLDSPLVPVEREGSYNIAVFPESRMVAEMFQQRDMVNALRWVGDQKSLDGCP